MIKHIETLTDTETEEILAFTRNSCIGLKAISPLISYGTQYDFAEFWVQRQFDDSAAPITAFVSRFYGDAVLFASPSANLDELKMFMRAIGYAELVSNVSLFDLPAESVGYIMKLASDKPCVAKVTEDENRILENEGLREFYESLCKNYPGNIFSRYDEWLVDLSHRIRHGTMQTAMLIVNDIIVATAAALVITEKAVLLGAISVDDNFRGRHYAHTLVKHYADKFSDRDIYIMCKPDKVGLYEKAGFEKADNFYRI